MKNFELYNLGPMWSISPKYYKRHEKTIVLHMRKQRRRSAMGNREADQRLCFCFIDSTISLLSKFEISSL